MPAIVDFPDIVKYAESIFGDIFKTKASRTYFCKYLTGLISANNKTITGINDEFVGKKEQSNFNRWISNGKWDETILNERRLQLLQRYQPMKYSKRGVIAIDNVLVDHAGKHIENVGWFWDDAEKRYKIAHDIIIANYVTASKHFPLYFDFFMKQKDVDKFNEDKGESTDSRKTFKSHNEIFKTLLTQIDGIEGDVVFDSYFTNSYVLNFSNETRGYVGDLKFNRLVLYKGEWIKASQIQIPPEVRKKISINGKIYWYFTKTVKLRNVNHKVRVVLFWRRKNSKSISKILVTNRTRWEVTRISKTYRCRWTGTETFHRDGKQHLGMGDCQLRGLQGQTRHLHMVCLANSLLSRFLPVDQLHETKISPLNTIGAACRDVMQENLRNTISLALKQAEQGVAHKKIIHNIFGPTHSCKRGFQRAVSRNLQKVNKMAC